jgi:hypothetical protein
MTAPTKSQFPQVSDRTGAAQQGGNASLNTDELHLPPLASQMRQGLASPQRPMGVFRRNQALVGRCPSCSSPRAFSQPIPSGPIARATPSKMTVFHSRSEAQSVAPGKPRARPSEGDEPMASAQASCSHVAGVVTAQRDAQATPPIPQPRLPFPRPRLRSLSLKAPSGGGGGRPYPNPASSEPIRRLGRQVARRDRAVWIACRSHSILVGRRLPSSSFAPHPVRSSLFGLWTRSFSVCRKNEGLS